MNDQFSPLNPNQPLHWSCRIPPDIQIEIGSRIREQLFLLPVNLFLEWHEPNFLREEWFLEAAHYILREEWFLEAAHYIEIPFFYEYWGDGND